jgi:hypothetical protein
LRIQDDRRTLGMVQDGTYTRWTNRSDGSRCQASSKSQLQVQLSKILHEVLITSLVPAGMVSHKPPSCLMLCLLLLVWVLHHAPFRPTEFQMMYPPPEHIPYVPSERPSFKEASPGMSRLMQVTPRLLKLFDRDRSCLSREHQGTAARRLL